jgi:hypothetical protein
VLILLTQLAYPGDIQVGTLSEGACWYEFKEALQLASFNDKTTYAGTIGEIRSSLGAMIKATALKGDSKIKDIDLILHCGGHGAAIVAKVITESTELCLWAKFDKGKLSLASIGQLGNVEKNNTGLCDGHKWGEFIMGIQSNDLITELQSPQWSSMIKEVSIVASKVAKVVLTKEYEFREQEVIDQLQQNFSDKNFIRYIEFNDYRHPVGEFVHLR